MRGIEEVNRVDIQLGVKARAHARRAGAPWREESKLKTINGATPLWDWIHIDSRSAAGGAELEPFILKQLLSPLVFRF